MNIGQELKLKQGKNTYEIKLTKLIANLPSNKLYLALDENGTQYIFSVYDGLSVTYSIGKYDDGLWGTKPCKIKVSILDRIRGWLKL